MNWAGIVMSERREKWVKYLEAEYKDQPELLAKKLADFRKLWWDADQRKKSLPSA